MWRSTWYDDLYSNWLSNWVQIAKGIKALSFVLFKIAIFKLEHPKLHFSKMDFFGDQAFQSKICISWLYRRKILIFFPVVVMSILLTCRYHFTINSVRSVWSCSVTAKNFKQILFALKIKKISGNTSGRRLKTLSNILKNLMTNETYSWLMSDLNKTILSRCNVEWHLGARRPYVRACTPHGPTCHGLFDIQF